MACYITELLTIPRNFLRLVDTRWGHCWLVCQVPIVQTEKIIVFCISINFSSIPKPNLNLKLTFCKRHFSNTPRDGPRPTPTGQQSVFPTRCPRTEIGPYCSPCPNFQFLVVELSGDCLARVTHAIARVRRFLSAARLNHFREVPTKNFAIKLNARQFFCSALTIWRFFKFLMSGGRYSKSLSLRYNALKVSKTMF